MNFYVLRAFKNNIFNQISFMTSNSLFSLDIFVVLFSRLFCFKCLAKNSNNNKNECLIKNLIFTEIHGRY